MKMIEIEGVGPFPRRNSLDHRYLAETAICEAIREVEECGADTRLTDAVVSLTRAFGLVADVMDERE